MTRAGVVSAKRKMKPPGLLSQNRAARKFYENPPEILNQSRVKFGVLMQRFTDALPAFRRQ